MTVERLLPWVLRIAWLTLPFTAGSTFADALSTSEAGVRATASSVLWAGWLAGLVALLVPHPVSLTALRVLAPAGAAATLAVVDVDAWVDVAAVVAWGVVVGAAAMPEVAVWMVNGSAYPNERRLPLRVPGPLLLGPIEVAWAASVALPAAGILLLGAGNLVAGGGLLVVAVPVSALLLRSLHSLSRRWVVFVPAGLVLHDPLSLVDPVLFRRPDIEVLRPAPAGTDSLDLTRGALGLALELVLVQKVPMALMKPGLRLGEQGASARLMFTPTRPGAVLREAAQRRIPVA